MSGKRPTSSLKLKPSKRGTSIAFEYIPVPLVGTLDPSTSTSKLYSNSKAPASATAFGSKEFLFLLPG